VNANDAVVASELVEIAAYGRHAHPEFALELSDGYPSLMCEQSEHVRLSLRRQ
jgi:hypothetical protein